MRRSAWWTESLGLFMLRNSTCTHCVGYLYAEECIVDGDSGPLYAVQFDVYALCGICMCAGVRGGRRLWASLCCVI